MSDVVVFDGSRVMAAARKEATRIADLPADLRHGVVVKYDPDAKGAADAMRAQLDVKPSPEHVLEWLMKLNFAVANPLTMPELRARLGTYYAVLGSYYPVSCWTDAALGDASRRCKFFPGTAELADLMEVKLARCRAVVSVLYRMSCEPTPMPVQSREPYPVQIPPPEQPARSGSFGFLGETAYHEEELAAETAVVNKSRFVAPVRSVEQQLAALGLERDPANPAKVRAVT